MLQAAISLVKYFDRVVARDASEALLKCATQHPALTYHHALAEDSKLAERAVDLVTIATALHWFDQTRFHAEMHRVLRKGGVIAAWCYQVLRFDDPALDTVVDELCDEISVHWPPGSEHIRNAYRDLPWPYREISPASFEMIADYDCQEFAGYLGTWSAVARYVEAHGESALERFMIAVRRAWGHPTRRRVARFPLSLRVGIHDR